ncbi:MAG: carbonic anhydrase family protein [Candidatus Kapaibacterium sp.]
MKQLVLLVSLFFSLSASAQHWEVIYPKTKEFQQSLTPDSIIVLLKDGNERFLHNTRSDIDYNVDIELTSYDQYPWAVIYGCMDSRVTPEIAFDAGIGDIFVNRLAGNVITKEVLGSMEYACKVAGSKLILVMGHTSCGAVKGAIDKVELGNLTEVVKEIMPAVDKTVSMNPGEEVSSKNHELVDMVAKTNVEMSLDYIRKNSPILKEMEDKGEIKIVGAVYDVSTGRVSFLQ